jgi:hypothetical protein
MDDHGSTAGGCVMTAPTTNAAPDTLVDGRDVAPLIKADVAELSRRFPWSVVWFGMATGNWWAYTKGANGERLIEAHGPYNLSVLLDSTHPAPPEPATTPPDSARSVTCPPVRGRPRGSRKRHGRHARDQ